jgi:hypothetical protein
MQHQHPFERHDEMADTDQVDDEGTQPVVARTAGALRGPEPFHAVEEERAVVEQIIADDVAERMNNS